MQIAATIRLDSVGGKYAGFWRCAPGAVRRMLRCDPPDYLPRLIDSAGQTRSWPTPIDALRWLGSETGGEDWIGWLSYDLGRYFENLPVVSDNDLQLPLFVFTSHAPPTEPLKTWEATIPPHAATEANLASTFSRTQYEFAVQRAIDYIAAGDVFQVNLSQRFTSALPDAPREIYHRLMRDAPATFGAYLEYADHALICNSPELFLHVSRDRRLTTRPIKGTRPLQAGMERQLRDSLKDQAELNMIVDLERNDLGRVCEIGSVKVTEPRTIEAHPTVYHGVATIEGKLRPEVTFLDLLRATFPGGSVTGAPKIRAMELIEELEPVRRGPYCGSIGRLNADGSMMFNIAIRTMIVKEGSIHIPVGGGIVADSSPSAEYEETLVKAKAMLASLEVSMPS